MRKLCLLCLTTLILCVLSFTTKAQPTHYQWHAEFFSDWYGTGVQTTTQTLGVVEYENVKAQATKGAVSSFVLEWDSGYNRWYNQSTPIDAVFLLTWSTSPPSDSHLNVNSVLNSYYTLRIKGRGYSNRSAIIMRTTNAPVTIPTVTDNLVTRGTGNPCIVSITLSETPSAEEKVFVRYTNDNWATSSFVQATGTGANYTASIDEANLSVNSGYQYYVFTTTVAVPTHSDADLMTLSLNNNGGTNFTLPVELTSFAAKTDTKGIVLNWNTATEVSNLGFDVERSLDKTNWQKIAFVNGSGNSNSPKNYSYRDNYSVQGSCYYRLRQIDTDGKFEYSKVIEVKGIGAKSFTLEQNYPNPFNPNTKITFTVNESGKAKLIVYDVLGKERAVLFNGNVETGKNYNVNFNGANMESGVYFYKLTTGSITSIKKMILIK